MTIYDNTVLMEAELVVVRLLHRRKWLRLAFARVTIYDNVVVMEAESSIVNSFATIPPAGCHQIDVSRNKT